MRYFLCSISYRCNICQEGEESGRLQLVQTLQVSEQFKYYALHAPDPMLRVRLSTSQVPPISHEHGWAKENGKLTVIMTDLLPAPVASLELATCSCKKSKCESKKCSCKRLDRERSQIT